MCKRIVRFDKLISLEGTCPVMASTSAGRVEGCVMIRPNRRETHGRAKEAERGFVLNGSSELGGDNVR
jgi:hypothetical protein